MSGMSGVPKTLRPDWDEWALGVAVAVGPGPTGRADCTRRKVGAVVLDANHHIAGAGYNGSYSGGPSCLKGECPRGRHYEKVGVVSWGHCACGNAWPCPDAVAPGSSYDTGPGSCVAVHAEINALFDVSDKNRLVGSTMYITEAPCDGCLKIIKNTPVVRIVWPGGEYVK